MKETDRESESDPSSLPVFERHMPLPLPEFSAPRQQLRLEDCNPLDWVPDSVVPEWIQDEFGRLFSSPSGGLPWIFRFTRCIAADGGISHVWLRSS